MVGFLNWVVDVELVYAIVFVFGMGIGLVMFVVMLEFLYSR